jgi:hypothetical protein
MAGDRSANSGEATMQIWIPCYDGANCTPYAPEDWTAPYETGPVTGRGDPLDDGNDAFSLQN